ncbi:MAG: ubiquitin-like protein Pup [Actinomycetaceae bacterium]|nr:ubiquitin-like protein Pup [Actinomycetaceae bacterium]
MTTPQEKPQTNTSPDLASDITPDFAPEVGDMDALLDDIDALLDDNASDFVRGFVQKGGH